MCFKVEWDKFVILNDFATEKMIGFQLNKPIMSGVSLLPFCNPCTRFSSSLPGLQFCPPQSELHFSPLRRQLSLNKKTIIVEK